MTQASRPTRYEALLFERECQGVRTLTVVRGLFVLGMVISHWIIGVSNFEKFAATAVAVLALIVISLSLVLLKRRLFVGLVGLTGCFLDVAVLSVLPLIWYVSVGGSEVPAAYMLKTQITVVSLGLVVLNALAIRPIYPILVAGGSIAIHLALLLYVLGEARTVISSDFLDSALGPAISVEFVLTSMFTIALTGAALGYLTHVARRTVVQSVRFEVANAQLERYFSPGVASRVSAEAETLLGGRTQEVAVLFCDLRDFTTTTENLPPSEVVNLLSQYHRCMVDVIFRFGGTIDKFIGDAIMVTFGTPDPQDDDAERSVRAGLAMNTALAELNAERAHLNLPKIRHGIGIHFGPVIAGNIGTEARLEYTVIGDTVNVASRIQDACKSVGEVFLISDAVKERLPPDIPVRPLPEQHVKGRQAPVQIYAVGAQATSD